MHRLVRAFAIAAAIMAAPVGAQYGGSDGEAFISAMKDGDSNKALELVEKPGSTVASYRSSDGSTGLNIAIRRRDSTWVGFLLSREADPDLPDKNGDTPLILAARMGFTEAAARLLMARAQVDKTNKLGETPLTVAVVQRQPAIVKMLLEAGANPDQADHASGYTAREYAKRDGRSADILKLIESVKGKKSTVVGPVRP